MVTFYCMLGEQLLCFNPVNDSAISCTARLMYDGGGCRSGAFSNCPSASASYYYFVTRPLEVSRRRRNLKRVLEAGKRLMTQPETVPLRCLRT